MAKTARRFSPGRKCHGLSTTLFMPHTACHVMRAGGDSPDHRARNRPSGAVIPNVTVTVVNTGTNISYVTKSQPDGSYETIPLHVGSYRVIAEQTGFKRVVRDGIVLQIQQTALVDIVMEVGQINQQVEVTGAAPL